MLNPSLSGAFACAISFNQLCCDCDKDKTPNHNHSVTFGVPIQANVLTHPGYSALTDYPFGNYQLTSLEVS